MKGGAARQARHGATQIVVGVALVVLFFVSAARAEEVPQITSFTASPSTVKAGESTVVSANWSNPSWPYDIAIVNADTGAVVTRCWSLFPPCSAKVSVPWSANASPKDLHFVASAVREREPATASGSPLSVHVERFEWNFSLSASKNPLNVGEGTTLRVEGLYPSPRYTGYYVKIFNDDTGQLITACAEECTQAVNFPYSMQADAGPVHVHAEVVTETAPYDVAGREDLTLFVDPLPLRVGLAFSEPKTSSTGEQTWLASATPSPQLYSNAFETWIYRSDGTPVTGCALWVAPCSSRVGPGTYRAVIKDSENIYASTQWWTIASTSSAEPEEEAADDFNLLALAAMFATPSEVCTVLLFYPGTHFQGGSVSDQYLACEGAVSAGKSTAAVLKAVAAAGGGTAVLWYLYEQKTKEQTSPEETEPAEETEPPPAPPIGWPGEVATEAEVMRQLNPQLQSEREARVVIKQCHRLTIRAALPTSDCTDTPIFASGDLDVPQATKHDLEALLYHPSWVKLNYESRSGEGREWYRSIPVCAERSETINCDEFPFYSTQQGGGSAQPRPSLKLISATQNRRQGGKLGRFYAACGVNVGVGKPFLNVPMPPGSNVPTLILCNGNS